MNLIVAGIGGDKDSVGSVAGDNVARARGRPSDRRIAALKGIQPDAKEIAQGHGPGDVCADEIALYCLGILVLRNENSGVVQIA